MGCVNEKFSIFWFLKNASLLIEQSMMQLLVDDGLSPNKVAEKVANPDVELLKRAVKNLTDPQAIHQLTSPAKVFLETNVLLKRMAAVGLPDVEMVCLYF